MLISWAMALRTLRRGRRPSAIDRAENKQLVQCCSKSKYDQVRQAAHTLDVITEVVLEMKNMAKRDTDRVSKEHKRVGHTSGIQ